MSHLNYVYKNSLMAAATTHPDLTASHAQRSSSNASNMNPTSTNPSVTAFHAALLAQAQHLSHSSTETTPTNFSSNQRSMQYKIVAAPECINKWVIRIVLGLLQHHIICFNYRLIH